MNQLSINTAFNMLLAEKGMQVVEVCKKANVSRSAIYKTFSKKATPRMDNQTMKQALWVLDTSLVEFIIRVEELENSAIKPIGIITRA